MSNILPKSWHARKKPPPPITLYFARRSFQEHIHPVFKLNNAWVLCRRWETTNLTGKLSVWFISCKPSTSASSAPTLTPHWSLTSATSSPSPWCALWPGAGWELWATPPPTLRSCRSQVSGQLGHCRHSAHLVRRSVVSSITVDTPHISSPGQSSVISL